MKYNWQHKNWPDFVFDAAAVQDELWVFSEKTGRIDGLLTALPETMRMDTIVELMVPFEMKSFIHWFNATSTAGPNELRPGAVRAAIAHLYFESIHPFEDGNGRIGRAHAEKARSQGLGRPALLSLSKAIDSVSNVKKKPGRKLSCPVFLNVNVLSGGARSSL